MYARPNRSWLFLFGVAAVALFASIPVFLFPLESFPFEAKHDLAYHLHRICGIAAALADGQFPVRMQTTQFLGYGYPVSIYYGDIFLYLPALLKLAGMPAIGAYKVFVLAVNIASAALAYICFARIFSSRKIALVACVLWVLCPYRLECVYLRSAVGEYLALVFYPMLAYGFVSFFKPAGEKPFDLGWMWCGIGMACIVMSHMLSILLVLLAAVPILIILLAAGKKQCSLGCAAKRIGLAAAACIGLVLWFAVPFLDYCLSRGTAVLSTATDGPERAASQATLPSQLFAFFSPMYSASQPTDTDGSNPEMPQFVGWHLLFALVLWLFCWLHTSSRRHLCQRGIAAAAGWALFATTLVLLFMATDLFFWGTQEGFWGSIAGALSAMQFPWRLLGPASFLLVCLTGICLQVMLAPHTGTLRAGFPQTETPQTGAPQVGAPQVGAPQVGAPQTGIPQRNGHFNETSMPRHPAGFAQSSRPGRAIAAVLAVAAIALAAASLISFLVCNNVTTLDDDAIYSLKHMGIADDRYLPEGEGCDKLDAGEYATEPEVVSGQATVESYVREGTDAVLAIDNTSSDTSSQIELPMFYYPHFEIHSSGTAGADEVRLVTDNRIVIYVPAHFKGEVSIVFAVPLFWRLAEAVSAATALLLVVYALRQRYRRRSRHSNRSPRHRNRSPRHRSTRTPLQPHEGPAPSCYTGAVPMSSTAKGRPAGENPSYHTGLQRGGVPGRNYRDPAPDTTRS